MSKEAIRKAERALIKATLLRLREWELLYPTGLRSAELGGVTGRARSLVIAAQKLRDAMKPKRTTEP